MKRTLLLLAALMSVLTGAPTLHAQCSLTLSEEGIVRIQSGQTRLLTWTDVPGASSYLVEELIEGINEPSGPDFTFGGPYTESRNYEGRGIHEFRVSHAVTYKMRFRYTVTALNRENASWQPCKDDVLFVMEPDAELATLASLRIVPFAGKTRGRNGADYATALVLAGTGLGPSRYDGPVPPRPDGTTNPSYDELPKLYQGRIYFRPIGTSASDSDPSIEYALGGEETLVFDDIMARLGATGVGTLEVRPKAGYPSPLVDAVIENRAPSSRASARVPAVSGRAYLQRTGESATVGIHNAADTRLAFGIRSLAAGGTVRFDRFSADGFRLDTAEREIGDSMTMTFALDSLFATPLHPGQRIIASFLGFSFGGLLGHVPATRGGVFFLTETGNLLNNPNVVSRDSLRDRYYSDGYDPFLVY